jgi:NADH-quinone oxidoreductase subunit L
MFKASLFMAAGAILHIVGSRFMTDMGGLRKNMNKTFIFMLLSGLSLAGAPLITSGFWSKDAIFASLLESGTSTGIALFFIAFIVAIMTAFYTFRMVGMVFFGTKSKHIQTIEQNSYDKSQSVSSSSSEPSDEHSFKQYTKPPLHEVRPVMWIPFAILAISTVLIGLVGFIFEGEIHSIMASYLSSSFGIGEPISAHSSATNLEQNAGQTTEGLNPIALVSSFLAFGIGSALGILFYIIRKKDPEIISQYPVLKHVWLFFYNRWYLNSLLYWGFVKIPLRLYQLIWLYFENIIAQGINPALQYSMSYLSKWVKYTQTGVTQTYLFVFAAGIIVVLLMLYL